MQWRRNLYEKNPHKDTFYDGSTFLDSLKIVSLETISIPYAPAFYSIQVVSIPFLIMAIHSLLKDGHTSSYKLFCLEIFILISFSFFHMWITMARNFDWEIFKVWSIFLVCFRIGAPAFQALTLSFSEDTILAVTFILFIIHMISNSTGSPLNPRNGTVSLSAAMLAVLILASRLRDPNSIVVFLLFSIILIIYLPSLVDSNGPRSHLFIPLFAISLWISSSVVFYSMDIKLFSLYETVMVILCFIVPHCFLQMLRRKKLWKGPWDTAEVF